ncbi:MULTISPECIES: hypothetical protein [unclassified Streptomyces]|uniref:hypothetical protein n=1 Tax=unclassified Streptomyces TaxID=2593676 RepID=UPI00225A3EE0|nr:hypothetical protein [Streptomyces sp. NBC_00198]MCX5282414.1 hypothetical protein [Streptomyces sp. NBC_00198]
MVGRQTRAFGCLAAAAATRACLVALRGKPPGGPDRWARANYAGRTVDLLAGPASAVGATFAAARVRPAAGLAVAVAGACGVYDDLAGVSDPRRGLRAHLGALRDGKVTSGAVKLFGITAAGLVTGALIKERPLDKLLAGVVIAGAAHFVNLVDVRPGRAAGAVIALGVPGVLRGGQAGQVSAGTLGTVAAVLGDDLAERAMIGDAGAHALGAALGTAVVLGTGRAGLAAHAAALVAAAACGHRVTAAARWGTPEASGQYGTEARGHAGDIV